MHNHPSGPAPDFISLQSTTTTNSSNNSTNSGDNVTTAEGNSRHFSKRGRGGSITSSHRGRYGPPSLPRGLVQNSTRTKRKREPTSAENSGEEQASNLHLDKITKMPWHPLGFTQYSPGIIG